VTEKAIDSPYVVWDVKGFEEELEQLLTVSNTKIYRDGEIIYLQGQKSKEFFFVRQGRVKVSILRGDGSEKTLSIQEDNTFFGEYAAFDGQPHFATAVALERSEIARIPVSGTISLIAVNPTVALLIISRIARKYRSLGFQVEGLAFLDAQRRVARILVSLANEVGEQEEEGIVIRKGITHEGLASLTGLSRVRVTTVLNNLDRADLIKKKRGELTIIDLEKLHDLLEEIAVSQVEKIPL